MSIIRSEGSKIIIQAQEINYTDNLFEFPILLFRKKKKDTEEDLFERLGINNPNKEEEEDDEEEYDAKNEAVEGKIAFFPEDIKAYGDAFGYKQGIDNVKQYGFQVTEVYVRSEPVSYFCTWPLEKFKFKLNEHINAMNSKRTKSIEEGLNDYFAQKQVEAETKTSKSWIERIINKLK